MKSIFTRYDMTIKSAEYNQPVNLKFPKECKCGRIHYLVSASICEMFHVWFNCRCRSTLFVNKNDL